MLLFIAVLVFVCAMLLVISLSSPAHDRSALSYRIDSIARNMDIDESDIPSLADAHLDSGFSERVLKPGLRRLAEMIGRFTPAGATEEIRKKLAQAGNPGRLGVGEFLGIKVVSFAIFMVIAMFLQGLASDLMMKAIYILCCLLAGYAAPDSVLQQSIGARQSLIRRRLPDTIDLLVVSVEAGLGFDAAVAKVVTKIDGPIAEEFGRVLDEMRVGKPRGVAMRDMAARIDIPEVTSFVAAIYQSEQLGVSIASVLRVQSASIREARSQRIREAAAKLPVKMLIPLIFFIFPSIFVVMMAPGVINIVQGLGSM
jgi:tight adherence protein C